MFQIKHLDHLVLRVTDLKATMSFYIDVLGCSVEKVQDDLGLYQLRAGTALIDLVPIDGELGRRGRPVELQDCALGGPGPGSVVDAIDLIARQPRVLAAEFLLRLRGAEKIGGKLGASHVVEDILFWCQLLATVDVAPGEFTVKPPGSRDP